jgi:hypothetical protein
MIGATAATDGSSALSRLFSAPMIQKIRSSNPLAKFANLAGGKGNQTTATISGPGELLSNLEQLQAKDPAKFKQVAAGIANKLQAAAHQAGTGTQGSQLSELAAKFQSVASGGSLAQLASPQSRSLSGPNAYSQVMQNSSASLLNLALQNGSQSPSTATNLQQLFTNILNDVTKALKS